jgi:hypothetical protein
MNACIRRAWLLRLRGRARPGGAPLTVSWGPQLSRLPSCPAHSQ